MKRKYPKSFYDDGLGDFLEWIDDEVLAPAELNSDRKRRASKAEALGDDGDKGIRIKKKEKKKKIYGDNEIKDKPERRKVVEFHLDEPQEIKPDKNVEAKSRGLINRLAAQTMPFVTSEFEKLYSTNSRSMIDTIIFNHIESSIIKSHAIAKRKLVAELMLLVSYLDLRVSHGIAGFTVHRFLERFEKLYKNCSDHSDKSTDNILYCVVNLYVIGLLSANVIFEIANRLCRDDFGPKSVELLLLIFKSVGFQLRKDNPSAMRQLILAAQTKCEQIKSKSEIDCRVEFMIEALAAIKNNNVSKIGNYGADVDKDTIESTLKGLIKRTKLSESLVDATYEEILSSQSWYLLETRIDDTEREGVDNKTKMRNDSIIPGDVSSKKEKKICKALGLNKSSEKTIFSTLLRVSDFIEASNRIIGFGLNHCSDAMLVCIQVAIHEKSYNPFYYNLINNLCKFNRKYKLATKFAVQDKIRALSQMNEQRMDIFKVLCLELIKSDAIPITILKAVEWANLSNSTKEYLTYLLKSISDMPEQERKQVMVKVEKKSTFAGAMRTFIRCFLDHCDLFE